MLASRIDQENAIHARQQAAAAKPLNQGVKGLAPKTLGPRNNPKTPGKVPLNDENDLDEFNGGGKDGKGKGFQKNLFQTPAPRDRPALGFKTTNAKATAFATPAAAPKTLGPSPSKTTRKTVGRSRLQIHKETPVEAQTQVQALAQPEPEIDWANEEIQYIPPKDAYKPLEDVPSDDEWDKIDFSILRTANFEWGRMVERYRIKDEKLRREAEEMRREEERAFEKEMEGFRERAMESLRDPEYSDSDSDRDGDGEEVKRAPLKQARPIGTLTSHRAASALSQPKKAPSYAAPTATSRAKVPSSGLLGHKKISSISSASSITARAPSYQTLGYAKGRAVSSTVRPRPPPSSSFPSSSSSYSSLSHAKGQPKPARKKGRDPLKELRELIHQEEMKEFTIDAAELMDFGDDGGVGLNGEDGEEEDVFQMKMPDEI